MRYLAFVCVALLGVGCATAGGDAAAIAPSPRFAGPVVPSSPALEPVDTVPPALPDDIRARFRGASLDVTALVCVDRDGYVQRVAVEKCDDAAKDSVESALARWRFKGTPEPVCFRANYDFAVGD